MDRNENSKGFSLTEVIIVIAIIAIMSAIAIPNLISWLSNKGLQNAARDLYSNMRKAQSTAVKNNRNCAISFDGTTGYLVYVDSNKNYTYDAGEQTIASAQWSQYRNVQLVNTDFVVTAGKPTMAFQPDYLPVDASGAFSTKTVQIKNSIPRQLSVIVSMGGNITLQ